MDSFIQEQDSYGGTVLAGVLTFDPWSPAFREDPYPLYARIREESPLHRTSTGTDAWVVSRYADCVSLLRSPRVGSVDGFAESPEIAGEGAGARTRRAEAHARIWHLVETAVTPWTLERLRPRIERLVECLFDAMGEGDTADLVRQLASPLAVAAVCELLDVPTGDRGIFRESLPELARVSELGAARPETRQRVRVARRRCADTLARRIEEDEARPGGGLLTRLCGVGDARLARSERVSVSVQLALAGYLMTRGVIGNLALALLRQPEQLRELEPDPGRVAGAVEECMRWDPALQIHGLVALEDMELHRRALRRGQVLWLLLAAANRDPRAHLEPERFDPRRAGPPSLAPPGAAGIGLALARMATEVAGSRLARRRPRLALAGGRLERAHSARLRFPGRLPVAIVR